MAWANIAGSASFGRFDSRGGFVVLGGEVLTDVTVVVKVEGRVVVDAAFLSDVDEAELTTTRKTKIPKMARSSNQPTLPEEGFNATAPEGYDPEGSDGPGYGGYVGGCAGGPTAMGGRLAGLGCRGGFG